VAKAQWEGSVGRKHIVYRNAGRLPDQVFCPATARRNRNNRQTSRQLIKNISVEAVVSHSPQHELPYVFEKTTKSLCSSRWHRRPREARKACSPKESETSFLIDSPSPLSERTGVCAAFPVMIRLTSPIRTPTGAFGRLAQRPTFWPHSSPIGRNRLGLCGIR
jgi:hypothetical protein